MVVVRQVGAVGVPWVCVLSPGRVRLGLGGGDVVVLESVEGGVVAVGLFVLLIV